MTIAVDFDGTIVEHKYPAIGPEMPFAIDTLKQLSSEGHQLILWSVREGSLLDEAVEYCRERGLEFYAVNSDYPQQGWSGSGSRKIKADVFIDDRNIGGLPDWGEIYEAISSGHPASYLYGRHKSSSHGSVRSGSSYKPRRKSLFKRIVERCRAAREKYNR